MVVKAEVQNLDVNTLSDGTDQWNGIESISINRPIGIAVPVRLEGETVPSAIEKVGTDELVGVTLGARAKQYLVDLADKAQGNYTFTTRNAGAGTNAVYTITNLNFEGSSVSISRDSRGQFTLTGKATAVSHT